jgi:hypothetical protein
MTELSFADVKIHNEIEFCIVTDIDIKAKIERVFLNNRISYCEKWENPSLLSRIFGNKASKCTICINSMQADKAQELLDSLHLDHSQVEMVMKRVERTYF